jgi:hypothetical protein
LKKWWKKRTLIRCSKHWSCLRRIIRNWRKLAIPARLTLTKGCSLMTVEHSPLIRTYLRQLSKNAEALFLQAPSSWMKLSRKSFLIINLNWRRNSKALPWTTTMNSQEENQYLNL